MASTCLNNVLLHHQAFFPDQKFVLYRRMYNIQKTKEDADALSLDFSNRSAGFHMPILGPW